MKIIQLFDIQNQKKIARYWRSNGMNSQGNVDIDHDIWLT